MNIAKDSKLIDHVSAADREELTECVTIMDRHRRGAEQWWNAWQRIDVVLRKYDYEQKRFISETWNEPLYAIWSGKEVAQLTGIADIKDSIVGVLAPLAKLSPDVQRAAVAKLPTEPTEQDVASILDTLADVVQSLPEPNHQPLLQHRDDRAKQQAAKLDEDAARDKAVGKLLAYSERARKEATSLRKHDVDQDALERGLGHWKKMMAEWEAVAASAGKLDAAND